MADPAAVQGGTLAAVLARESAATEERHWVRLTRRCNTRCVFCHDAERQDGTVVSLDEVVADIRAGRERGATRLVLSGGEPTVHPRFLAAVEAGRAAGYRWVQVITNGRMCAYPRFVERAAAAGIDEATVSIHGHTPELHDGLVGVPGAFAQAIAGVRNLRRAGRVVSVDVVVCKPNVRHLPDILRFLLSLGIREFDLLHLVPFGRGFDEHRGDLFYDHAREQPRILEALAIARMPGVHVWTNRWPAPLLEGAEHLIQDPHKILDEVRGTREGLEAYLATGSGPRCRGERCGHCFLEGFCLALFRARDRLVSGTYTTVSLDATAGAALAPGAREAVARQSGAAHRIVARTPDDAERVLRASPRGADAPLELDVPAAGPLLAALGRRVRRLVVRRAEDLGAALACAGAELELPLEKATVEIARRARAEAPERTVLVVEGRARLSEVLARDLAPHALAPLAEAARAEGLPPCVAPRSAPPREVLDASTLRPDGALDLLPWAERWVRDGYRTRSLRCRSCAAAERCPGAHVNAVRAHGFGFMRPDRAPRGT